MTTAMWAIGGLGLLLAIFISLRYFKCKGCHGDGFVSETDAPTRAGLTDQLPVYEDKACELCDGGKWMKYMRCPRCVGRGQIHRGPGKMATCPRCKGSGRLKLPFGAWVGAFVSALFTVIGILAAGVVLGWLLWGIWIFLAQFAAEAGMATRL